MAKRKIVQKKKTKPLLSPKVRELLAEGKTPLEIRKITGCSKSLPGVVRKRQSRKITRELAKRIVDDIVALIEHLSD